MLLLQSGDIEINPGPMKSSRLNFCQWNLNGTAAHNFVKAPLIEAFIKANNIDIIRLSETFLDSTVPLVDEILYIKGYLMIRANHPSNTKRGSVCILKDVSWHVFTDHLIKIKSSLSPFAKTS